MARYNGKNILFSAQVAEIPVELVQTTGDSTVKVMSQKAVTEEFKKLTEMFPDEMRETVSAVYDAGLEQGALDSSGNEIENNNRVRTGFIPVGMGIVASTPNGTNQKCAVKVYDANKVFIGYAQVNDNGWFSGNSWGNCSFDVDKIKLIKTYNMAKYIRAFYDTGDIGVIQSQIKFTHLALGDELNGVTLDEVYGHTTKRPYQDYNIPFFYTIDEEGHYTKGWLKLPLNYKPTGKPVPMIVFMPASNCFTALHDSMVVDYYEQYYNYLRDCGYAIFSCYGWGNKYPDTSQGVWGTPTNDKCHIKGIQYVCEHYNIDSENVFVTTKSLGGIQALSMCYQNEVKIKACGLLSPELDPLGPFGYARKTRAAMATDWGLTGDWQSVLDVENSVFDRNAAYEYMLTQADKVASANPIYRGVLLPTETKIGYSFDKLSYDWSAYRLSNVPIKIWIAPDDGSVYYGEAKWVIQTLKNAGCDGELRTMPEGTGGHASVDRAENALQTTNVTTRLGVHYETIPTAYYELEQYFAKFAF